MEPDLALVTGLFLAMLAIPSIVSALSDARWPKVGVLLFLMAGGFGYYAYTNRDGGYTLEEIPTVIYTMIATLRATLFTAG